MSYERNIKRLQACRKEGQLQLQAGITGLTKSKACYNETRHQAVNGKVRENFPREPELGYTGIVKRRVPGGEGGSDVLVKGPHDNDGQRRVKQVVAPHKPAVKNTLANTLVSQGQSVSRWMIKIEEKRYRQTKNDSYN